MTKKSSTYFFTGLISLIPIVFTVYIIIQIFKIFLGFVESLIPLEYMSNYMIKLLPRGSYIILTPKILIYLSTFIVLYFVILLVGVVVKHFLDIEKTRYIESLLLKIPMTKPIYSTIKQIVSMILLNSENTEKTVVILEYPKVGIYSIGFMTNTKLGRLKEYLPEKEMVNIFIPTAPNPTTGFYIMVPRSEIQEVDIKVEEALKLIVSAGAIVPQQIMEK